MTQAITNVSILGDLSPNQLGKLKDKFLNSKKLASKDGSTVACQVASRK